MKTKVLVQRVRINIDVSSEGKFNKNHFIQGQEKYGFGSKYIWYVAEKIHKT